MLKPVYIQLCSTFLAYDASHKTNLAVPHGHFNASLKALVNLQVHAKEWSEVQLLKLVTAAGLYASMTACSNRGETPRMWQGCTPGP